MAARPNTILLYPTLEMSKQAQKTRGPVLVHPTSEQQYWFSYGLCDSVLVNLKVLQFLGG